MPRIVPPAVLALSFTVSGCRQPDYFPITEGSRWALVFFTYDFAGGETTEVKRVPGLARVVTVSEDSAAGRYYVVQVSRDSAVTFTLYFQTRPPGTFMLVPWLAADIYSSRGDWICIAARRLRPGKAWFGNSYHEQLFEVISRETVVVPAGRFPGCYKVAVRTDEDAWPGYIWFAPRVGPVRWEYRSTRSRESIRRERVEAAELVEHSE